MTTRTLRELLESDTSSTAQVAEALANQANSTSAELLTIFSKGGMTPGMRAKVVAALWMAVSGRPVLRTLMSKHPDFASAVVLKRATEILDTPRKMRLLERKLAAGCKSSRRMRLREELATMGSENVPAHYAASRCFCNVVKQQLQAIPSDRLEFDLLFYSD